LRKTSAFARMAGVALLTIALQLIGLSPALPPAEAVAASSNADMAVRLRAKSTILFSNSPDGTTRITKKVWVPNGGQVGVYGQNNNRWGFATLDFNVLRDGRDITGQFWKMWGPTGEYPLRDNQIVNKRVTNRTGSGHYYWIIARCDIRTVGDCDGTFTISSWY
jgi:hypothetical protein